MDIADPKYDSLFHAHQKAWDLETFRLLQEDGYIQSTPFLATPKLSGPRANLTILDDGAGKLSDRTFLKHYAAKWLKYYNNPKQQQMSKTIKINGVDITVSREDAARLHAATAPEEFGRVTNVTAGNYVVQNPNNLEDFPERQGTAYVRVDSAFLNVSELLQLSTDVLKAALELKGVKNPEAGRKACIYGFRTDGLSALSYLADLQAGESVWV